MTHAHAQRKHTAVHVIKAAKHRRLQKAAPAALFLITALLLSGNGSG